MPVDNKFKHELLLEQLDYDPVTLIVGTFNPGPPLANEAAWYYGRAGNCAWNVLPRIYGEPPLSGATEKEWRQFCRDKQIALTDIISSIDDAEPDNAGHSKILSGFSDAAIAYNFDDFSFVNIVQLLQRRPSIKNVYFTRGITEAFWRHLWNPVMQYCNMHGLHERKLLTPTAESAHTHETYNEQHADAQVPDFEDFILMRWQQAWHFQSGQA